MLKKRIRYVAELGSYFKITAPLLLLGLLQSAYAGAEYYWSGGRKINIETDRSSMILHYHNIDADLSRLRSLADPSIKNIRIDSANHRAIIDYAKIQTLRSDSLVDNFQLKSANLRDASFAVTLDGGFRMWYTHEIVLKLNPGVELADLQPLMQKYNITFKRTSYKTQVLEITDISQVLAAANDIRESGLAKWSHPNFAAELSLFDDPLYPEQYYLNNTGQLIDNVAGTPDIDIDAPEAWAITTGSSSVTVAVIDQGVEAHEDFTDINGNSRILNGYPVDGRPDSSDDNHGQACAGIIGASHNDLGVRGVAPDVMILPVNIWHDSILWTTQDVADAITWAWQNGADVASNSWGYSSCTENLYQSITDAITDARTEGRGGLGTVVVFSAGNNSSACVNFPANVEGVLAVGAIDKAGESWWYSATGPRIDVVAPSGDVNLAGDQRTTDRPGAAGYADGDYFANFGGTSGACPEVAGVAALLLSANGALTEPLVTEAIKSTATDMGSPGKDDTFGYGRVDADDALNLVLGGNFLPVANANGPYRALIDTPIAFSSAGSSDLDGSIASFLWDFGDGGTSGEANPIHSYTNAGIFDISLTVTDNEGSTGVAQTFATLLSPDNFATLPYSTDFESGALDGFWTTALGAEGRIEVSSEHAPASGGFHLLMDDHTNAGAYSQNEAWLHLNLAGQSQVSLSFQWKEFGDETHAEDGIFFSDDGGTTFTKVHALEGGSVSNNSWQTIVLDLDELAAANGLILSGTFVVKFQQYDNYAIATDGFAFDDISVTPDS